MPLLPLLPIPHNSNTRQSVLPRRVANVPAIRNSVAPSTAAQATFSQRKLGWWRLTPLMPLLLNSCIGDETRSTSFEEAYQTHVVEAGKELTPDNLWNHGGIIVIDSTKGFVALEETGLVLAASPQAKELFILLSDGSMNHPFYAKLPIIPNGGQLFERLSAGQKDSVEATFDTMAGEEHPHKKTRLSKQ